jgi:hypothetical protein
MVMSVVTFMVTYVVLGHSAALTLLGFLSYV